MSFGTNSDNQGNNEGGEELDNNDIDFNEELSKNDDLFDAGIKEALKGDLNIVLSGQMNENKDKTLRVYADENLEEAIAIGLYTPPPLDDDTLKLCRDVEFDACTMDDPKLSIGLLFRDFYQFRKAFKKLHY